MLLCCRHRFCALRSLYRKTFLRRTEEKLEEKPPRPIQRRYDRTPPLFGRKNYRDFGTAGPHNSASCFPCFPHILGDSTIRFKLSATLLEPIFPLRVRCPPLLMEFHRPINRGFALNFLFCLRLLEFLFHHLEKRSANLKLLCETFFELVELIRFRFFKTFPCRFKKVVCPPINRFFKGRRWLCRLCRQVFFCSAAEDLSRCVIEKVREFFACSGPDRSEFFDIRLSPLAQNTKYSLCCFASEPIVSRDDRSKPCAELFSRNPYFWIDCSRQRTYDLLFRIVLIFFVITHNSAFAYSYSLFKKSFTSHPTAHAAQRTLRSIPKCLIYSIFF